MMLPTSSSRPNVGVRGTGSRAASRGTAWSARAGSRRPASHAQDRRLEALEGLAGLDAELVGQGGPRVGVHLEGLVAPVLACATRSSAGPRGPRAWGSRRSTTRARSARLGVAAEPEQVARNRSSTAPIRSSADEPLVYLLARTARPRPPERAGPRRSASARSRVSRARGRLLTRRPRRQPLELHDVHVVGLDRQAQALRGALESRPRPCRPGPARPARREGRSGTDGAPPTARPSRSRGTVSPGLSASSATSARSRFPAGVRSVPSAATTRTGTGSSDSHASQSRS